MCSDGAGAGDGGDSGIGLTGYGFDQAGNFTGGYDVGTGKTDPNAGFVSEMDTSGAFTGGYGIPGSPSVSGGLTGPGSPAAMGGSSSTPELPPKEAQPEAAPEVKEAATTTQTQTTTRPKKRTRRPTILTDEQGLIYTSPGKRKSLLGG